MGVDIPASAWSEDDLPDHLKMRIAITDPNGKILSCGRSKHILKTEQASATLSDEFRKEKQKWEKTGLVEWNFTDLPENIAIPDQSGNQHILYPRLSLEKETLCIRLFEDPRKAAAAHKAGVRFLFTRYLKQDIAFLKKHLKLSGPLRKLSAYFGGPEQLQEKMLEKVTTDLLCRDIRTRQDFLREAETISKTILPGGSVLLDGVTPVLSAFHETRSSLYEIDGNSAMRHLHPLVQALRADLENLVPENFVTIYDIEKIKSLPRYLDAMRLRIQRAAIDYEKDRKKADMVAAYDDVLADLLAGLTPEDSPEKREEIENYFWLLQEYKVSIFAQELKTPFPVSAKKLNAKQDEIRRMR
jgi:ATP-dependent helicase HrpA